jgi:hypothetical protein
LRRPFHSRNHPSGRDFEAAVARAAELKEIVKPRHRNPASGDGGPNHWECWLHDPDGYTVVLASPDGSAGKPAECM